MKIAVISTMRGYSWAGSEEMWHTAGKRALKEGHSVTAFLYAGIKAAAQLGEFEKLGGEVCFWHVDPIVRLQQWKEKVWPSFPAAILDRFDVILVSLGSLPSAGYTPGLVGGLLATRRPVVLLCQFNSDHLSFSSHERESLRHLIGKAKACAFVSKQNLEVARRQFAIEPPNATVIPNQSREHQEQPLDWPINLKPARFACVARFEILWKGQDLLLEVLSSEIWRERNWQLHFYGNGPDLEHIQRLIKFFGLEERVCLEGYVRDLAAVWKENHLLVLPSRGEGMPLAMLEAMMFGRPVVTTDVGGNGEILRDGVTGFMAKAATPDCFGEALERAWLARERWSEMGRTAHLKAKELSVVDLSGQLVGLLVQCAGGGLR